MSKNKDLKDLISYDPLMLAKERIENKTDFIEATNLLKSAIPYHYLASQIYKKVQQFGINSTPVQDDLNTYCATTYDPIINGNESIADHWLIKLGGCAENIEKNGMIISAIFGFTSIIAGWPLGAGAAAGAATGYCFVGMHKVDNTQDHDCGVKMIGKGTVDVHNAWEYFTN